MAVAQVTPEAPGESASGTRWTETTRLMCAAAYLDGTFAQDVVDEILHEHYRAIQIPPGVDIGPVAKHCVAARQQKVLRDVLLMGDLVLAVVLLFAAHSLAWLAVGFLVAWAIVLWDIWRATYQVVVKRLNALAFSSHMPPQPSDQQLARRIDDLVENQHGNLAVYSGFLPFSGAGLDLGGWSFVVDLRKGSEDRGGQTPAEMSTTELYDGIRNSLEALQMTNLKIEDRLFVSGSDIREDRELLPNPVGKPESRVEADVLRRFVMSSTHRVRHYQCIRVVDWRGELVISLFLRFAIRNGRLFCELSKFVLVPLKEELHHLDGIGAKIELRHVWSMVRRSFFASLGLWLRSPRVIFKPIGNSRDRASKLKQVEQDPFFDYGAPVTALDRVRSTQYRRYFQRLDKEMYVKILERTSLDTIVEILDRHGVDTAELADRRKTIINNGIMMPGGSIQANNVAVGAGARIMGRFRAATGASNSKEAPVGPPQ